MLTFHDSPSDMLAFTLEGTITSTDLSAIMDRLDLALQSNDPLHLFVETRGIDGLEWSALPSYSARALPLFSKLRRFGRVAVVADQSWIRIATRLESAILPFISYRIFEPPQRDEALAWATSGRDPSPR